MKIIGYIVSTIAIATYSALMGGWALSTLWSWFIVKTFDAPPLGIASAIGLSLVVHYMTIHPKPKTEEEAERKYWEDLLFAAVVATFKPLVTLSIGAIVKLWM
jgi:hypothetical protein